MFKTAEQTDGRHLPLNHSEAAQLTQELFLSLIGTAMYTLDPPHLSCPKFNLPQSNHALSSSLDFKLYSFPTYPCPQSPSLQNPLNPANTLDPDSPSVLLVLSEYLLMGSYPTTFAGKKEYLAKHVACCSRQQGKTRTTLAELEHAN